jgi:plastocyanin
MRERPVPQQARQKTAATQPFPGGEPFVPQEPRLDKATRPVPFYETGGLFTPHWDRPVIIFPGAGGGADWAHLSFSPHTGWIYVGYGLINSGFSNARGGRVNTSRPLGEYFAGGIAAVDPVTNKPVWTKDGEWSLAHGNGILTTAGRLMFQGGPDGVLHAMDDTDGEVLWSFQTGAGVHTSPISYEIDGEQYIAVLAGGNWLPYPDIPKGDHLWAFKLGGTVAQNAMSPQHLTIAAGTTVTFVNPVGNAFAHAAVSFFDDEFDTGVLMPGGSWSHTFTRPGTYFYNDAVFPQNTGKIVVS